MSRFLSEKYATLKPYTPGEQPRDMKYVKLNTNESPFPPSPAVLAAVSREAGRLNLYCDPECTELKRAAAELYGVKPEQVEAVSLGMEKPRATGSTEADHAQNRRADFIYQ